MNATGAENSKDCNRSMLSVPFQHKKLVMVIFFLVLFYTTAGKNVQNRDFDYFVFSQRWLPTSCIEYVEHSSGHSASCILPNDYQSWAIHGLWPTQNNHMGPFYCNRSMPFDESRLHQIEPDLRSYWPNIEGGHSEFSLWKHEWEKHGTCAAQLQSLDTEIKYFTKTLDFYRNHNINKIFKEHSVTPSKGQGIRVDDVFKVVKDAFGTLPQVQCIHEAKTNQPFLSEVRLCYNKKLKLINCRHGNHGLTNCPADSKIMYPDSIDLQERNEGPNNNYFNSLAYILNFLRFLIWASI